MKHEWTEKMIKQDEYHVIFALNGLKEVIHPGNVYEFNVGIQVTKSEWNVCLSDLLSFVWSFCVCRVSHQRLLP